MSLEMDEETQIGRTPLGSSGFGMPTRRPARTMSIVSFENGMIGGDALPSASFPCEQAISARTWPRSAAMRASM